LLLSYCKASFKAIGRALSGIRDADLGDKENEVGANHIFYDLWRAIPAVISAAERKSREELPGYWEAHDKVGTSSDRLMIYGIWFDPANNGSADYEVGANFVSTGQVFDQLPELPDDYSIMIYRAPGGILLVQE
jgi:hypothetical protein